MKSLKRAAMMAMRSLLAFICPSIVRGMVRFS
jgi:hypothetical protein